MGIEPITIAYTVHNNISFYYVFSITTSKLNHYFLPVGCNVRYGTRNSAYISIAECVSRNSWHVYTATGPICCADANCFNPFKLCARCTGFKRRGLICLILIDIRIKLSKIRLLLSCIINGASGNRTYSCGVYSWMLRCATMVFIGITWSKLYFN